MLSLGLGSPRQPLNVLCVGAHSDDLEIGCAGTVLEWIDRYPRLDVSWLVLSATGERAREARASATRLLAGARNRRIELHDLLDGHFPAEFARAKALFESLKSSVPRPDVILCHRLEDRHQDHRVVAELVWQTWRDHLILEYEIPKYEGDLGQPNIYVPISPRNSKRKVSHLMRHFGTQRAKTWFRPETFEAVMHLRAIECRAPGGSAEAFHLRKGLLG